MRASRCSLSAATLASYEFKTQNNGVSGEIFAQGRSGNLTLCPFKSTPCFAPNLCDHGTAHNCTLSIYFENGAWHDVKSSGITSALKGEVKYLGPTIGYLPKYFSTRSLQAVSAMILLDASIDGSIIRLLIRWRSDDMLWYLHLLSETLVRNFSRLMVQRATYNLHSNHEVLRF